MPSPTPLGLPAVPPATALPTWKQAWDQALYGERGYFRREAPAARRPSADADRLARALARLTRDAGLDTVVDIGAGRGELLTRLHAVDPGLELLGVEGVARPAGLPDPVAWTSALPESVDGLVVADGWLRALPCHVVVVDGTGTPRVAHVDPGTGREELGHPVRHPSVPTGLSAWLDRWWPLSPTPGERAEVGSTRDAAWADVVGRVSHGIAVAIDHGHLAGQRPRSGGLRSVVGERELEVVPDGSRPVTAPVALDAVAAATAGVVRRQRDVLETTQADDVGWVITRTGLTD